MDRSYKRRHPRQPTRQRATVSAFGGTVPCEILNFCRSGLYLSFGDARARDLVSSWLPGTMVEVSFGRTGSLGPAGATPPWRLAAAVAHASPAGLGVEVSCMPEEALRALQAAAGAASPVARAKAPSLQERLALHEGCSRQFEAFLVVLLDDFFPAAAGRLQAQADQTRNHEEQQVLRQAHQALAAARGAWQEAIMAAARLQLEKLKPGPREAEGAEADSELSLMGDEEFEDWLNLSAVINQIDTHQDMGRLLGEIERLYGGLSGRGLERHNNPFGPGALCGSLQSTIRSQGFSNDVRAEVYAAFGQSLMRHLPPLCRQLLQTLSGAEIAPAPASTRPGPPPAAEPAPVRHPPAAASQDPADPATAGADPGADVFPEPGEAAAGSRRQDAGEYSMDRLVAALNGPRQRAVARPAPRAGSGGGGSGGGARRSLIGVAQSLRQAFSAARPGAEEATLPMGLDGLPAGAAEDLGEVLRVIDRAAPAGWIGGPADASALSERIASLGPGLHLAPPLRQTLDTAGNLLGQARAVSAGGAAIGALLQGLERPLLKLSLQDRAFLESPDHPARQVVDLLEQYSIAADDQGRFFDPRLQRFLQSAVERIVSQADRDPGVYEAVRDSLDKLLQPVRQTRQIRVARLQEACEARHRVRRARTRTQSALGRRTAGHAVAESVQRLLDAGWRQHLVLLEMRAGQGSAAWTQALQQLDRLLAALDPRPGDGPALGREESLELLARFEQQLARVNPDPAEREAVTAVLAQALEAAARAVGTDTGTDAPARPRPEPEPAAETEAAEPASPALAALLARLRVGDWWHFQQGEQRLAMQLIWLSETGDECAFANRSATQKQNLSLAELDQRLRDGSVRPWVDQDQPLLERSEQALVDGGRQQLQQRATHDAVTGLVSRKGFQQRLEIAARQNGSGRPHMLGVLEFDQFRVIYQACGVEAAEALTRALAQEAQAVVGTQAVLASFRDDTLAVLLPECGRDEGLGTFERLLERLRDFRYQPEGHSYRIGVHIGAAEYLPGQHSPLEALQHADMACVAARSQGRNRLQVYERDNRQLQSQHSMVDWAGRLDSLLDSGGLYLRAQRIEPIFPEAGLLPHYEVLLGIDIGAGRAVEPMTFIPAIERLRRAPEVDLWVIRRALDWVGAHADALDRIGGISINLSAMSLSSAEVIAFLHQALPRSPIPCERIIFEITETAAIESYAAAGDFIRQMRRYGCRFSLDDFGSGHTSYAHLKNLRADTLKIDGSFVRDIADSPADFAMVKSMNDIAHSLGMKTVAEFVESPQILACLREIGVDYAQGYAVHRPCPIEQILVREAA